MSGSNSSVRDAAVPEAVTLTVYPLDGPELDVDPRRTARGRLRMFLVLLVCAAPVVASYLSYFVFRPSMRNNYGALIEPPRPMPGLQASTLDGQAVPLRSLQGQWLLVVVGPAACGPACEKLLYAQRQLREMMGRDRDRVDKVWLLSDTGPLDARLRSAVLAEPAVAVLRAPAQALASWLEPEPGHVLPDHLYLVDPMGRWMMRFPADFDPMRVKRDLDRLLRASASWDRPGR